MQIIIGGVISLVLASAYVFFTGDRTEDTVNSVPVTEAAKPMVTTPVVVQRDTASPVAPESAVQVVSNPLPTKESSQTETSQTETSQTEKGTP